MGAGKGTPRGVKRAALGKGRFTGCRKHPWLPEYLLARPGCVMEYKPTWDATLCRLGGKIFALYLRDGKGTPMLNLKCDPYLALDYRDAFPGVLPGWHMNKLHWNSLLLEGDTPDEIVRELVDISYGLVRAALPKKVRENIG